MKKRKMKKKMVMTEGLMLLFVRRGRIWNVQLSEKGASSETAGFRSMAYKTLDEAVCALKRYKQQTRAPLGLIHC